MAEKEEHTRQQASVEDVLEAKAIFEGLKPDEAAVSENQPKRKFRFRISKAGIVTFLFTALLTFIWMWVLFSRSYAIGLIKNEIVKIQNSLNEAGWDVAYNNISFSPAYPGNLATVQDFQFYSLYQGRTFKAEIPKIEVSANLFNPRKITIRLSPEIKVSLRQKTYNLDIPNPLILMDLDEEDRLAHLIVSAKEVNVRHTAQIGDVLFSAVRKTPANKSGLVPAWGCSLLVGSLRFDKKYEIALSDKIDMIFAEADVMGKVHGNTSYRSAIYEWLEAGGYINMKYVSLNWKPLALVGRGSLYFNEKLEPNLHLDTSSKGLAESMDSMLQYQWLDGKGVFVSKILLGNKAFKLSPKDKYLTVIAPIDYKDSKLLIENITVAKF